MENHWKILHVQLVIHCSEHEWSFQPILNRLRKGNFCVLFSLFFLTQFIFRLTGNFRDELKTTFIYVNIDIYLCMFLCKFLSYKFLLSFFLIFKIHSHYDLHLLQNNNQHSLSSKTFFISYFDAIFLQ